MASSIVEVVRRIKADVAQALDASVIESICRELGHTWRDRMLDPVTTIQLFLLQVLHGNVACSGLRHLATVISDIRTGYQRLNISVHRVIEYLCLDSEQPSISRQLLQKPVSAKYQKQGPKSLTGVLVWINFPK